MAISVGAKNGKYTKPPGKLKIQTTTGNIGAKKMAKRRRRLEFQSRGRKITASVYTIEPKISGKTINK